MDSRRIYADHAATTPVTQPVLEAMLPYLTQHYGNPSSIYEIGRFTGHAIEKSRKQVADVLGAKPNEIYFTGCGTESDNWAIRGAMQLLKAKGKNHIITTNIEHHAVLYPCQALEKQGFAVTYLPVNAEGFVTAEQVEQAITPETGLVTVMFANNEIGTIQPIAEIGAVCRKHKVLFHTDAVQAIGQVPIDVNELQVDLLSLSGHKFHAPKGVGALYCRQGVRLENLMYGGGQERTRRPGTENVASIVGLGEAITLAEQGRAAKVEKLTAMRDRLIDGLLQIPYSRLNGGRENRLCGNVNISFEAIEGEALLLMLDMHGICASSGSACTSGDLDPSHVLLALGLPHEIAHGSLRLSLGEETTEEDIDYILEVVPTVVERLRAMSPVWDNPERILRP